MMMLMMDESYRIDPPPNMCPGDLDSTWLGGEPGQSTIKVKPAALNTARLKVFRQATRGAVLSILETGHVSIEFLKRKGDQDRLVELFVISGDGQEICVEQWKIDGVSCTVGGSHGHLIAHTSGDIDRTGTWKTFTYSCMPEKYWKKYSHACRFVDLMKTKTAKVTIHNDRAKGVLMENWPPNFEATFFHGPKIVMCGSEVHIREESGGSLLLHRDSLDSLVNDYSRELIQHATQMREQCLRLEASVMTVQAMSQNSEPLFPVTVGMRPSTSFCSSTSSNSGSIDLLSSPRFNLLHSPPSSSSGSQGHPASPPSSPLPQIDLRCLDSPVKQTPTSIPSPAFDGKTAPQSPFRHVSTLEGRKLRRQFSDCTDSGCIHHHSSSVSAAQSNPDLCCHASPYPQENTEQDSRGGAGCGLMNSLPGTENQRHQGFPSEIPEQTVHGHPLLIVPPVMSASPQRTPLFNSAQRSSAAQGEMPNTCFPGEEQGRPFSKYGVITGRETTVDGNMTASCFSCDTQSMSSSSSSPMKKTSPAADRELSDEEASSVVRQAFVAYTGWASQHANGTIWIRYNEGTQLGVYPDQPEVVYVDQQGFRHRYLQSDNIPEVVRQKLEKLPTVLDNLKRRPSASPYTPAST